MDNAEIQLVGGPCGQHGPYTFYKAFKYTKNGVKKLVTLSEFFFVKLWIDSDLLCIGELQLLWSDKNSEQVLSSLRLYFLPENTPEGRMDHGEDEVLAISEKVVLRVEDLITWITLDAEWTWGRLARCEKDVREPPKGEEGRNIIGSLSENSLDFSDVEKERKASDCLSDNGGPPVVILSYPRYCRYRSMMRRLEGVENEFLKYKIVNALGGFTAYTKNTRVLFCKDTFDYPDLEGHELLCNHLAPKLKGRPRGKRKKRSVSPGSESNESESSVSTVFNSAKEGITENGKNGLRCNSTHLRRSTRAVENSESKEFLRDLTLFMKTNYTPIGKIPSLGYKELDLYSFYTKVQKLGGYDSVTTNRLWKSIFDDMSGHANSTSAATVIRRHYERFLLPYERHIKGEEYKPLPVSERRRLKSKAGSSTSDPETSESTSRSGNSTPIPKDSTPATPTTPTENKEFNLKSEQKPSSLRSIRVKPERQKDKLTPSEPSTPMEPEEIKTEEPVAEVPKLEPVTPPEKDLEPLTSAVAPQPPEKPLSPLSPDVPHKTPPAKTAYIDMPYKPKSPEIIDLESDAFTPTTPFLHEVKKRKLEILREGGLEVTPVRTAPPTKETRPTVIQQAKPIRNDMPPPPVTSVPLKRVQLTVPQAIHISPVKPEQKNYAPPKVMQSKSIYSYSERTVYGNPKDFMSASQPVHTPKFVGSGKYGGDILDLTVTSPQKPVVEIMKVPTLIPPTPKLFKPIATPPILDGRRLGSNLEITLVDTKKPQISYQPHKFAHKRHTPEHYAPQKLPRIEDNAYIPQPIKHDKILPSSVPVGKHIPPPAPPPLYFPPLYDNKAVAPFLNMLDPVYYSTLQSLYGPPIPFPSPEQWKYYTDLMAQNPRPGFSFSNSPIVKKP